MRGSKPVFWILTLWVTAAISSWTASAQTVVAGITEPFLDVTVSSSVPGIIGAQKFREGDFVNEGQIIVALDKRLEELEVDRRRLVAENRKTDVEATRILYNKTKSVSKDELDKKEVEYNVAVVEHDMAAEQLRKREIAAPVSGTITEFFLDVGEACQPYQPMLRLVDTRRCYFVSNLESRAAIGLKPNQTVNLEIEAGDAPVKIQGKIVFLSPVVDPASGLMKVKALFENADGKIRPGVAGRMLLQK